MKTHRKPTKIIEFPSANEIFNVVRRNVAAEKKY